MQSHHSKSQEQGNDARKSNRSSTRTEKNAAKNSDMTTTANNPDTTLIARTVDLGREDELVTWQEWFKRTMDQMRERVDKECCDRLAHRVTLADGRQFAVRQITTHVVKGRCSLEETRWSELSAVCNVITGYMLYGVDDDSLMTTLAVPPAEIVSVECVLVPTEEEEEENEKRSMAPFGFHSRKALQVPAEQREVEEKIEEGDR